MKLKTNFVTQEIEGTQFLVPLGREDFHGTAAFIVDCLKEETTPEKIVDAMCSLYKAPRETIAADVEEILNKLRSIHALEE